MAVAHVGYSKAHKIASPQFAIDNTYATAQTGGDHPVTVIPRCWITDGVSLPSGRLQSALEGSFLFCFWWDRRISCRSLVQIRFGKL
jgi:hypothetical protein